MYAFLADVLVAVHFAIVAFVVLGLVAILIGIVCKRSWARNLWFRGVHLAAILFIAGEALVGVNCPLTLWEQKLREAAGQDFSGEKSFIGAWIHRLLFFDIDPAILDLCHIAFGVIVLATFLVAPPRWRRKCKAKAETTPPVPKTTPGVVPIRNGVSGTDVSARR